MDSRPTNPYPFKSRKTPFLYGSKPGGSEAKLANSELRTQFLNAYTQKGRAGETGIFTRSGPKKERRRTESINSAFAELRECIPNVPADTKLSKIKTLRLATSYIAYLMDVLAKDSQAGDPEAFKAELKKADGGRESKRKRELQQHEGFPPALGPGEKRIKGRTGWPQQVWALELNQ
ncbi:hypothetical protein CB1_037268006 [Camelus ferus]|nr:hypothetical protein CB1_037268006 [Camelus ferus]